MENEFLPGRPPLSSSTLGTSTTASTPRGLRVDRVGETGHRVRRSVRVFLVTGPVRAERIALDLVKYASGLWKASATVSRQRHHVWEKTEAVRKRRDKNNGGHLEWACFSRRSPAIEGMPRGHVAWQAELAVCAATHDDEPTHQRGM